ncbi:MAG: glycoside hydrolase family 38 C-terminal domain-containing protein [Acidobacteriota bacterium]
MSWPPKTVHVVSHTHWDREWYLPFAAFRVHLTRVVRGVLDVLETDPDWRHFLLDGQSIVLEDHLEAHPEDEPRIRKLMAEGRLGVGPWYVLPDGFLISGEAHVRNLLVGQAVAAQFGPVQSEGYVPDAFGHVAQVPQLLREAGVSSFVYTRGNGDEIDELGDQYRWRAPDGSEVLALHQSGGYCNGAALGHEEIWHPHTRRELSTERAVEQVGKLLDDGKAAARSESFLLMNGCDHHPPQRRLGDVLTALGEAFPETEFTHGSLGEHVAAVEAEGRELATFEGELAGGRLFHVLSGVWSARMPLKQRNDRCQTWLAGQLEPLLTYCHFLCDGEYPAGLVQTAWKTLLANAPHDSICGCSVDEVHEEMGPRFDQVEQTAQTELARQLERLAPTFGRRPEHDADTRLLVTNSLPWPRREVLRRLVVLQPPGIDVERLRLVDEDGTAVPMRVLKRWTLERFWGVDYRTMLEEGPQLEKLEGYLEDFGTRIVKDDAEADIHDTFLWIEFVADLPALTHCYYRMLTDVDGLGVASTVDVAPERLENEHLRVDVHADGRFDLHDKRSGVTHRGLGVFEDGEDIGDEYDYSPAPEPLMVTSEGVSATRQVTRESGLSGEIELRFEWSLPARIEADRSRRSDERVPCPVTLRLSLAAGSPRLDIEVELENRAEDHRLRVLFPTEIQTDVVVSDGHFFVNERPVEMPSGESWVQPPTGTFHQQDFSLVGDGRHGLAVLADGLPEVAPLPAETGVGLALTLLRSVGWLSRDDFPTRRNSNAGPTIATPGAQCLGSHRFRYAVLPFSGRWQEAEVKRESECFKKVPLMLQGVADQGMGSRGSLVELGSGATVLTALKRSERGGSVVARLNELTGEERTESLRFGRPVTGAWRTDLYERRQERLEVNGNTVTVPLRRWGIATVEVELGD